MALQARRLPSGLWVMRSETKGLDTDQRRAYNEHMSSAFFVQTFVVTSASMFPLDMLRAENALPITAKDSALIPQEGQERAIKLKRYATDIKVGPNQEMWNKFGWAVSKFEQL